MLGCIQPMSSPMMKSMLGLPDGACANAGKFASGKLIAAKTIETSRLPIRLHIFMIRILLHELRSTTGQHLRITRAERWQCVVVFASGHR
jgi:hypothetical protein